MDDMGEKIRKLREDKDRLIRANYELARRVDAYRELLQGSVDSGQGHLTALQDIINIVNSGPVDDDAAGKIRDICNRRLFSSFDEGEPYVNHQSTISDFCDYIWKVFKKDEGKRDFDYGELGYFTGRYIRIKKIVESDEFKKLEGLLEKEGTDESV